MIQRIEGKKQEEIEKLRGAKIWGDEELGELMNKGWENEELGELRNREFGEFEERKELEGKERFLWVKRYWY